MGNAAHNEFGSEGGPIRQDNVQRMKIIDDWTDSRGRHIRWQAGGQKYLMTVEAI